MPSGSLPLISSPSSPRSAMILFSSFMDRVGKHQFHPPHSMWGYLPQVNQWGSTSLVWEVERVGGQDHIPVFKALPICEWIIIQCIWALFHFHIR